ncbi:MULTISPECIES: hypothetical protein [Helicobacter]|nr:MULTISPECIES: hypothetical protein [Helicobacter]
MSEAKHLASFARWVKSLRIARDEVEKSFLFTSKDVLLHST